MKGINTFTLKWIAIISMLIDHVGAMFFSAQPVFRIIGRLAFPIFAYTLVEGFFYTHDVKKYILRLGIFALVSEIPFDLAVFGKCFQWEHQNIYFTLVLGLVLLAVLDRSTNIFLKIMTLAAVLGLCFVLKNDYGITGIFTIWLFYYFRGNKVWRALSVSILMLSASLLQAFASLALIPISLHNGKQGPKMKYFFYVFYPAHLLAIYLLKLVL